MHFPYRQLNREELIERINLLASKGEKFLFIINYKAENGYVILESELDRNFIGFEFPEFKFPNTILTETDKSDFQWKIFPMPLNDYTSKFSFVVDEIKNGNSYLVNLTQPTKVDSNLSILDIFNRSVAPYKLWLADRFVVFSPETFVQIKGRKISSYPMKGTIDAKIQDAELQIINDEKEKAEHATIVDLIRNDLSIVADNVTVERYRYVEKITTNTGALLQVSSCITGNFPVNYEQKLGDIIFKMLPAGSISGAPKPKTLEIIEQAEGYERGFYTGIFGWYDGENLDSAVMIRFVEQQGNDLIFKSGGGITSQSDVRKEYEELKQKIYVPVR